MQVTLRYQYVKALSVHMFTMVLLPLQAPFESRLITMSLKMIRGTVRLDEESLLILERDISVSVRIDKYHCLMSANCVQSCTG